MGITIKQTWPAVLEDAVNEVGPQQGEGREGLAERYLRAEPDEQLSLWLQRPDVRNELDTLDRATGSTPARRRGWLGRILGLKGY